MNFAGRPEEKTNAAEQHPVKTEFSAGSPEQPQTKWPRKDHRELETKTTSKSPTLSKTEPFVECNPSFSPDMCRSPESSSHVDPVKLEERKKSAARLLGLASNSPESGRSSSAADKANERRDIVSRMIDTTRVRNGWRGNDGCDSTIDTLSLDGLGIDDDHQEEERKRPGLMKLPSVVNITSDQSEQGMLQPPNNGDETNLGEESTLQREDKAEPAKEPDPVATTNTVNEEYLEHYGTTEEPNTTRSQRPRRTGRRSSVSNVSVQVSVDSESMLQRPGRRARRSSISTVSIKLDFDDESIDTMDQNEALLNLINQAVASATATSDASADIAITTTAGPGGDNKDNTERRDYNRFGAQDDASAISYVSSGSARQRRSTMNHMSGRAHLQPPSTWLTGDTTTNTRRTPLTTQDSNLSAKRGASTFRKLGNSDNSSVNGPLSNSCHGTMPNRRHQFSSKQAPSFRQPHHELSSDQRRIVTTETTEVASQSCETSHSMHNIGLHNRYGFMVDDKQAKKSRRRSSLSWVSKTSETEEEPTHVVTPVVPTSATSRPTSTRCPTVSEPTPNKCSKVEDMRSSWHQNSPSSRALMKTSSRQLARGGRPPVSKSMSSRSLLRRKQMVRQTSTKSISRNSVVSNSVVSNNDVGRSSGHRSSLLSRSSSISKMTVVYQETSCEFGDSFDDLSTSEFGGSVASFIPEDDVTVGDGMSRNGNVSDGVSREGNISDCMSRIDQPILEYEEQTEQAKGLKTRSMSSKSLYSFKSIRSIGKKLGLSRKKSSKSVVDEPKEPSVTRHSSEKQESKTYESYQQKSSKVVNETESRQSVTQTKSTTVENHTKVFKRSISNVLSFRIGANKKEVKPEPWMLLQTDQAAMPWHDHQDSRMLTPYGQQEETQEQAEKRERRMRRRASM